METKLSATLSLDTQQQSLAQVMDAMDVLRAAQTAQRAECERDRCALSDCVKNTNTHEIKTVEGVASVKTPEAAAGSIVNVKPRVESKQDRGLPTGGDRHGTRHKTHGTRHTCLVQLPTATVRAFARIPVRTPSRVRRNAWTVSQQPHRCCHKRCHKRVS